ncbi:MAG TPA: DUF423 domain-containing protein [Geminicoccaceae bacterium]|nr:DUF423 domain-containing protein [Geminicoccus sp.]HMU48302.1 DUF423 domain-containing protein [Geminicoccaceae bacterium]
MPDRTFAVVAALLGLVAVAAGAFAAHGIGDPRAAGLVETASRYQMWHALAMLALCLSPVRAGAALAAFAAGVVLFSGSLYGLAMGAPRPIAWVTPVGGMLLIAGWALAALALWRR